MWYCKMNDMLKKIRSKSDVKEITALSKGDKDAKTTNNERRRFIFYLLLGIFFFILANNLTYFYLKEIDAGSVDKVSSFITALEEALKFVILPVFLLNLLKGIFPFNGHILSNFLIGQVAGIIAIGLLYMIKVYKDSNKRVYRYGEEYGSARFGDIENEAEPLNSKNNKNPAKRMDESNMILSRHIQVDMDTRHTLLGNDNLFVVGGSGSGKTRYFVKPNLLQMYCNYVVIDPKGSVFEETGNAFIQNGYEVRYLNLVDMAKSMGYNPFRYFYSAEDVQRFVSNLVENTNKGNSGGDPFWSNSEQTWLTAMIFYILATCEGTDLCNMNTVMLMLDNCEVREDDEEFQSAVDEMFNKLEQEVRLRSNRTEYSYADLAIKNYKIFKLSAGKTAKSILVSIGVRLKDFNLPELRRMMQQDELCLDHLGNPMVKDPEHPDDLSYDIDRKTYELTRKPNEPDYEHLPQDRLRKSILFIIISDRDNTFSYLSAIILQQMYEQIFSIADARHDKRLPIHTRIINDEFATCGKQPDFDRKINTMRSREISTVIIIQGVSQIKVKELYGEAWEAIYGGCTITLFLGGTKEESTVNVVKTLGGKQTVAMKTESVSKGNSSSNTRGEQVFGRDLIDFSDILKMKLDRCLVHIMGYDIFEDYKYDVKDHKNVDLTMDTDDSNLVEKNRLKIDEHRYNIREIDTKRKKSTILARHKDPVIKEMDALMDGEMISNGDVNKFQEEILITAFGCQNILTDVENENSSTDFDAELLPS